MALHNVWKLTALPVLLTVWLAGCATYIRLEVQRPPTLNTTGISRIAVMPFDGRGEGNSEASRYATTIATDRVSRMNHFTLVAPSEIIRLRRNNQSIDTHVDALLTGRVIRAASRQRSEQVSKAGEDVQFTKYITEVDVELNYSIMRARDGSLIGPVVKRTSHMASSPNDYPDASPLIRFAIEHLLKNIGRDLAPYTVVETRTFATDRSKNKAVTEAMRDALAQVRAGDHRTALAAYIRIYEQYKSVAAAENATILYEVLGDAKAGADLMRTVFEETGNLRAHDIMVRLSDQATIAAAYTASTQKSPADRVSAFAGEEIRRILPDAATIWFYNNSPSNAMAEAVVDNLTADFIRNGINVVDRQNAALIVEEQKLQMSGAVSDDEIVRVGNSAGANTIVVIGVAGTGALRRLQVRVLDIERGVPILQSDTGEQWQM